MFEFCISMMGRHSHNGCGVGILPGNAVTEYLSTKIQLIDSMPHYMDEIYLIYRFESKNNRTIKEIAHATKNNLKHAHAKY